MSESLYPVNQTIARIMNEEVGEDGCLTKKGQKLIAVAEKVKSRRVLANARLAKECADQIAAVKVTITRQQDRVAILQRKMSACVAELDRELESGEVYQDEWAEVYWRQSPGRVVIDSESKVPKKFWVRKPAPDPTIDKKTLKASLSAAFEKSGKYPAYAHVDKPVEVKVR